MNGFVVAMAAQVTQVTVAVVAITTGHPPFAVALILACGVVALGGLTWEAVPMTCDHDGGAGA